MNVPGSRTLSSLLPVGRSFLAMLYERAQKGCRPCYQIDDSSDVEPEIVSRSRGVCVIQAGSTKSREGTELFADIYFPVAHGPLSDVLQQNSDNDKLTRGVSN